VIRLALVGCGLWGKNYLKSIIPIDQAKITVICDTKLSVPELPPEHVKVIPDYRDVKDVDGVIVATPPSTHREIACHFLERQIPVLLEKPAALTLEDATDIFETALDKDTTVLVDNIHLFSSAFETLRNEVLTWDKPLIVNSVGGNIGPFRDYSSLYDYGPHDLAMCFSLFNVLPDQTDMTRGGSMAGDVFTIKLGFGSSRAILTVGNGMIQKERRFRVANVAHKIEYDDLADSKLSIDGMVCPVDSIPPLRKALYKFVKHIEDGSLDWRFDYELNLGVMYILEILASKL
jgi:predicted dehydrogenase